MSNGKTIYSCHHFGYDIKKETRVDEPPHLQTESVNKLLLHQTEAADNPAVAEVTHLLDITTFDNEGKVISIRGMRLDSAEIDVDQGSVEHYLSSTRKEQR